MNKLLKALFLVLVALTFSATKVSAEAPSQIPKRIISLAPSTTEILFELGAGDRVVAVTRYCDYPSSVTSITKVGGYVDPNYEKIVALKPDLVVLLNSHHDAKVELEKMRLKTISVPHKTVGDIQKAIRLIGNITGEQEKAQALLHELTSRTQAIQRDIKNKPPPRVLISIERDTESGQLAGMYMAGRNGFYNEIIKMAGGENAYTDEKIAYPQLSAEGVLQINPDVIVDLVSHIAPGKKTPEEIKQQWEQLRMVNAVRNGQLHVIIGNHALRPGPRYIEFLEEMAQRLHPEAFALGGNDE